MVLAALAGCALALPSPEVPDSRADCRVLPAVADTAAAVALAALAVVAGRSNCQNGCGPLESSTALPIAAGAALVGASAGYGYYGYARCRRDAPR